MFYFSSILGKSIKNELGEHIGRVHDMQVTPNESYPRICAVIQKTRGKKFHISWEKVKHVDHEGVIVKGKSTAFPDFGENGMVLLGRDILDKQIVDTNGLRVVRVNDIQLNLLNGDLRLAGIDVGTPGLLRRMGLLEVSGHISRLLKMKTPTNIISWDNVEFLGSLDSSLRLTTPSKKLTRLHPADLADILEAIPIAQQVSLLKTFDTETAAETLEHMEEDAQIALFSSLSDDKASDILEEMSPDEAADLLQDMPGERVEAILGLMEPDEAKDVRELLSYGENTAGGLMSPEFVFGPPGMTCQEAIEHIRKLSPEAELIYYFYVVDKTMRLLGVLSLRDIIVNRPDVPLNEIMSTDVNMVKDSAEAKEVVDMVAKYDLLAVPVVDDEGVLKGIITVDDVMDRLIPCPA